MIEKNKEYYNQKIGELYSVVENQEKIIRELQENYNNELDENLKMSELWLKSKERIDKAIEYIKSNIQEGYSEVFETEMRWDVVSGDDLLEILEGDNNE